MAELSSGQSDRARAYLIDALEIGVLDQRVRQTARELGVSLDAPDSGQPEPIDNVEPVEEVEELDPEQIEEVEVEPEPNEGVHEIDEIEELEEFEEVSDGTEGVDSEEIVELEPDEVEMIEESADGGDDQFPSMGEDIVEDSEFVIEEGFGEELDDELEAVSDLSEQTDPDAQPPPASDQPDRMAQTDFEEPAEGLGFTEEEVEGALNGLFDSFAEDEQDSVNVGADDPEGDLAQVDFYIQQELYDEAIEALEKFEQANPGHPGIDKRYYQIKTARKGGPIEQNPSGSASLSKEFEPVESDEHDKVPESDDDQRVAIGSDVLNTNFELGAAYRDMGLYDEAIDEFKQAIDDPDAATEARYHIAICKAEKGHTDEAADTLSHLLQNGDLSEDLRSAARDKLDELDAPRA